MLVSAPKPAVLLVVVVAPAAGVDQVEEATAEAEAATVVDLIENATAAVVEVTLLGRNHLTSWADCVITNQ